MAMKLLFKGIAALLCFSGCIVVAADVAFPEEGKSEKSALEEPIIVNGDTVEYSTDNKEITATGSVMVNYRGTKLTCQKLTVNTITKQGKAEGRVRIEDASGVLEGEEIAYNFENKTGNILDSNFRYNPYFGKAKKLERKSDAEFIAHDGFATTCGLDHPHYKIASKRINFFPKDKIRTKGDILYISQAPLFYLPQLNQSLKERSYHYQMIPGKSGDWGPYALNSWRFELNDYIKTRVYLDYRNKLGLAEGFGTNYTTDWLGKGDFKFYYTHEQPDSYEQDKPHEFQRYLARWRHKWDIDERSRVMMEYYKIEDSKRQTGTGNNFLKDYFYREYEKDAQPLTYASFTHAFDYSSLNILAQKRTNRWYTQTEKLPEVLFDLPEYKLGETPVYFNNTTAAANLNNKQSAPSDFHQHVTRFDTYNQFSLPFKASLLWLTPFVGSRETFYSQDRQGDSLNPRTVFYSGVDINTKLYRIYDVNSDFWGMDINGLRHVFTPSARFAYNHAPTIAADKLHTFDDIDTIAANNKVTLEILNKLQTKRIGEDNAISSVDFATFKINTDYNFPPKGISGSGFSDILFDLELIPYSWLRVETNTTFDRKEHRYKEINLDFSAQLGKERSLGFGHRYEKEGGNEMTTELAWRLSPKWKFRIYERYQFARSKEKGLKEQEYTFSRDLHCWAVDFTYNIDKDNGHSVWLIFRVKAFPETELKFNQRYYSPKASSDTNQ